MVPIDEITIRPFENTPEDARRVEDFFAQMGPESRGFFNVNDGNHQRAAQWFRTQDPTLINFMAEAEGRMVGYVFLYEYATATPWVGIAVAEDYKGKHFGRRLLAHVEEYARAHGKGGLFLTTHLANVRGQSLYTRCGYTRMGIYTDGEVLFFHFFRDESRR